MKYTETQIVFQEVPDEVALAINISGCPVRCPGCHSPHLAGDVGTVLDIVSLTALIDANPGISCVSFMGGDADPASVAVLAAYVHDLGLKTCWYSGRDMDHASAVLPHLDYIKIGSYMQELGGLASPKTNQRFYRIEHSRIIADLTARFSKSSL